MLCGVSMIVANFQATISLPWFVWEFDLFEKQLGINGWRYMQTPTQAGWMQFLSTFDFDMSFLSFFLSFKR